MTQPGHVGEPRPLALLREHLRRYPAAPDAAQSFRAAKGSPALGDWPDFCFLPLAAAYAIVSGGKAIRDPALVADVGVLGALLAWRMTKGVYRVDPPDAFSRSWGASLDGELPTELLFDLPDWCPYVELPPAFEPAETHRGLKGFFVHLEWDLNHAHPELRFVLDLEAGPSVKFLDLTRPTLAGCVAASIRAGAGEAVRELAPLEDLFSGAISPEGLRELASEDNLLAETIALSETASLLPLVSLAFFLCRSARAGTIRAADDPARRPANPRPRRTKKRAAKEFAAREVTDWTVRPAPPGGGP